MYLNNQQLAGYLRRTRSNGNCASHSRPNGSASFSEIPGVSPQMLINFVGKLGLGNQARELLVAYFRNDFTLTEADFLRVFSNLQCKSINEGWNEIISPILKMQIPDAVGNIELDFIPGVGLFGTPIPTLSTFGLDKNGIIDLLSMAYFDNIDDATDFQCVGTTPISSRPSKEQRSQIFLEKLVTQGIDMNIANLYATLAVYNQLEQRDFEYLQNEIISKGAVQVGIDLRDSLTNLNKQVLRGVLGEYGDSGQAYILSYYDRIHNTQTPKVPNTNIGGNTDISTGAKDQKSSSKMGWIIGGLVVAGGGFLYYKSQQ